MNEDGDRVTQASTLVREALDRARRRDPELRAIIALLDEKAAEHAALLDAEDVQHGLLFGVAMTLKDNIDVADVPSTAGASFLGAEPVDTDSTVVALLRAAGAVVVAKNNMSECAIGATNQNRTFGDCRNARDRERISGGSSGGSAVAVASGMVPAALGTDTGGSVRIPASVNGVAALRPTIGRISNRGVLPVSTTFDTVGPIARDVRTLAQVTAALDQFDELDPTSRPGTRKPVTSQLDDGVRGMRIGVPQEFFFDDVDDGVASTVRSAIDTFARLGARPVPVRIPGAEQAQERMLAIMYPEAAQLHRDRLRDAPSTFDPDVLRRLRIGEATTERHIAEAGRWREKFQSDVDDVFRDVDLVVNPTIPVDVPRIADVDLAASTKEMARFTYAWAMYGGPSVTVPCGMHPASGMPVGLHLSAPPWHEQVALQAALRLEEADPD